MHGHSAIQSMRGEKPTEYVKLVAAVRGKDMNGSAADALHALSDAELDRQIEEHARDVGFAITKVEVAAAPRREEAAADEGADAG
jgi:hypothetical protein